MVENNLKSRDISDENVLEVFRKVPREKFVPEELKDVAYSDNPLPIGHDVTISQPYIVALMCQILDLSQEDSVLDVGTGSGYQAAILSELCEYVVTIERISELARESEVRLEQMGYNNVKIIVGDGSKGYAEEAPYDGIKVAAATSHAPEEWKQQLSHNGSIVFPRRRSSIGQELIEIKKFGDEFEEISHGGVRFVPLVTE